MIIAQIERGEGMEQISLESARVNAGMTVSQIAKMLKKNEKTIYNWENGKTPISAYMFFNLCKIYKINADNVKVPIVKDGRF